MFRTVARQNQDIQKQDIQTIVDICIHCRNTCLETVESLQQSHQQTKNLTLIWLLRDCAELCDVSIHFMRTEPEMHSCVYAVCAQLSKRCADFCEWFNRNGALQNCIDACRQNAEACQTLSELSQI